MNLEIRQIAEVLQSISNPEGIQYKLSIKQKHTYIEAMICKYDFNHFDLLCRMRGLMGETDDVIEGISLTVYKHTMAIEVVTDKQKAESHIANMVFKGFMIGEMRVVLKPWMM